MVTMRSSSGMNDERTLSSVVLPEPVPPETKMFRRAFTQASRNSTISGVAVPKRIRSSTVNGVAGELPDGEHRADQRERRDDRVDAGAVGQAGVDHRARLVDAAADGRDDALDDLHHVLVVLEGDVGQLQPAFTLDVDLLRAVDHDLGDGLVAQERLERAEAEDLVGDLLEHAHALGAGEGEALLVGDLAEELLDLAPDLDLVAEVELRVELVDEPVLDAVLRLAERLAGGQRAKERARRRPAAPVAAAAGASAARSPAAAAGVVWRGGHGRPVGSPLAAGPRPLDPLQQ